MVQKVSKNGNVDQLSIRPIVYNLNMTRYKISNYLCKQLSKLRESEYTFKCTRHFMDITKHKNVLNNYQMLLYDVKSLFINVPKAITIDVVVRRIYQNNEIETSITKQEMRELL